MRWYTKPSLAKFPYVSQKDYISWMKRKVSMNQSAGFDDKIILLHISCILIGAAGATGSSWRLLHSVPATWACWGRDFFRWMSRISNWTRVVGPEMGPERLAGWYSNAINHPPNHHLYGWYKPSNMGGLWHCYTNISRLDLGTFSSKKLGVHQRLKPYCAASPTLKGPVGSPRSPPKPGLRRIVKRKCGPPWEGKGLLAMDDGLHTVVSCWNHIKIINRLSTDYQQLKPIQ